MVADSFCVRKPLTVDGVRYDVFSLDRAEAAGLEAVSRLPVSLKVLLESLLRHEDGHSVTLEHIRALTGWTGHRRAGEEIAFYPVRVLLPDSSGIPLLADLAAMRDAMRELGGDHRRVNPIIPIDFVIDHSLMVDVAGRRDAAQVNVAFEMERNSERYAFLRWAQQAFSRFRLVPPGNGILHQLNLEVLATVVCTLEEDERLIALPDAMVGMDSHTPMINSMGVLGWGVGGIEAACAILGQPLPVRIPEVIGCRLVGQPSPGVTTTDIVLSLTERLRTRRLGGAFVEFCGPALAALTLPERATLANMAVEYGATTGFFPIDAETLRYLRVTGRPAEHIHLVEAYAKEQGLWRDSGTQEPLFTDVVEFDLGAVEPSLAGPRRPQDRVPLAQVPANFRAALQDIVVQPTPIPAVEHNPASARRPLAHGDVVIAAVTSCTNTSNPSVMLAAGLLARNAVRKGLRAKPWVKTSLAPGSRIVTDYLQKAGLHTALDGLGFNTVGYGCTTCMGNSGPLDEEVARQIEERELVVTTVLSGNRNFESRIHAMAKANYLASPPLVVAYAIAGSVLVNLANEPLGEDLDGKPVFLRDIWPADSEIRAVIEKNITGDMFTARYGKGFLGSDEWEHLAFEGGETFEWNKDSQYIRRPPFLQGVSREQTPIADVEEARPLLILGDSITTDHISPIGSIPKGGAAGRYLIEQGVKPRDFNYFGARRVNHEVMMRGTFANPQIRNEMVPGTLGGVTRYMPRGEIMPVYDAAMKYTDEGTQAIVVAGAEYGCGSSRDWAAKGTRLLGIRAVIAESFERIHRSNLVGMGVLPLEFMNGATRKTLALNGSERFTISGLADLVPRMEVQCTIAREDGTSLTVPMRARIDTAGELEWYRKGGVLNYVLLALLDADSGAPARRCIYH